MCVYMDKYSVYVQLTYHTYTSNITGSLYTTCHILVYY